ncbi:MAG TPA: hypothetical protein VHB48_15995, partial [Chitinophagaceae bacterium]|nr:hypothetical protein [Chitinophagaceae bacterium]
MEFPVFLKEQFNSFVDCYKKYFRQTFGIAISFTILCFIFSAILFRFSDFDESTNSRQLSLLSYFFTRYSEGNTYSIVDLTKTVFIFFAALFSVTLTWFSRNRNEGTEVTFRHSFRALRFNALLILIFVLLIASMLDYYLFQAENYFSTIASNRSVDLYLRSLCFHLRIYLPLILFAITVWSLTAAHKSSITFKRILLLYISLWL